LIVSFIPRNFAHIHTHQSPWLLLPDSVGMPSRDADATRSQPEGDPPEDCSGPTKMEGWLFKQPVEKNERKRPMFGKFEHRYFVLDRGVLSYKKRETDGASKGALQLTDKTVLRKPSRMRDSESRLSAQHAFVVEDGEKGARKFKIVLAPESSRTPDASKAPETVMRRWEEALNEHILHVKRHPIGAAAGASAAASAGGGVFERVAKSLPSVPSGKVVSSRVPSSSIDNMVEGSYRQGKAHMDAHDYEQALVSFEACMAGLRAYPTQEAAFLGAHPIEARMRECKDHIRVKSEQAATEVTLASLKLRASSIGGSSSNLSLPPCGGSFSLSRPGSVSASLGGLAAQGVSSRAFMSYRVDSEARLMEALVPKLKLSGVNTWYDKHNLQKGGNGLDGFERDFCKALVDSNMYVPVLSRAGLQRLTSATFGAASRLDNLFLEMRLAVELAFRGEIKSIFPIFAGELQERGSDAENFKDYFKGGGEAPRFAEEAVEAVESAVRTQLKSNGLDVELKCSGKVKDVMDKVLGTNGCVLLGPFSLAVDNAVREVSARFAEIQVEALDSDEEDAMHLPPAGATLAATAASEDGSSAAVAPTMPARIDISDPPPASKTVPERLAELQACKELLTEAEYNAKRAEIVDSIGKP
jgi:hypothetical protein